MHRFAECLTNLSVYLTASSIPRWAIPTRRGADHRTSEVQCLHSIDEAFAFFAYEVSADI